MVILSTTQIMMINQLAAGNQRFHLPKATHWQEVNFKKAHAGLVKDGFIEKRALTIKGRWLAHSYTNRKDIVIKDDKESGWVYPTTTDTTVVVSCHFEMYDQFPFEGFEVGDINIL